MSERITSIEIDSSGDESKSKLSFSAFSYNLVGEALDAKVMKVTGLEAPSLNVTGGASSFGGSVYTGVTMSDREVVLTVSPTGSDSKSIKNRLNALVNRSRSWPLKFTVNTERGDGTTSSLHSDAYISGVSSPIFDKSDELQITLKMPQPFLERGPVILGNWSSGLIIPVPLQVVHNYPTQDYHSIGYSIPLDFSHDSMNADSPFSIVFTLNNEMATKLENIMIRDNDMNKVIVNVGNAVMNSDLTSPSYLFEYDGRNRTINTYLDQGSAGSEDLRNQYDYNYFIEPYWPRLGPDTNGIRIDVQLNGQYSRDVLNAINVQRVIIWPRMLGF